MHIVFVALQIKCHQYYPTGSENEGDDEVEFDDVGLKVSYICERDSNYNYTTKILQITDLEVCTSFYHTFFFYNFLFPGHGRLCDVGITCGKNINLILYFLDTQSSETKEVIQFHYTSWPDFGTPESPTGFLDFLNAIRGSGALDTDVGPPVIHCSAGIGRSGTFCLVDTCLLLVSVSLMRLLLVKCKCAD